MALLFIVSGGTAAKNGAVWRNKKGGQRPANIHAQANQY
jgi:hypothetical protein